MVHSTVYPPLLYHHEYETNPVFIIIPEWGKGGRLYLSITIVGNLWAMFITNRTMFVLVLFCGTNNFFIRCTYQGSDVGMAKILALEQ